MNKGNLFSFFGIGINCYFLEHTEGYIIMKVFCIITENNYSEAGSLELMRLYSLRKNSRNHYSLSFLLVKITFSSSHLAFRPRKDSTLHVLPALVSRLLGRQSSPF